MTGPEPIHPVAFTLAVIAGFELVAVLVAFAWWLI